MKEKGRVLPQAIKFQECRGEGDFLQIQVLPGGRGIKDGRDVLYLKAKLKVILCSIVSLGPALSE